MGLIHALIETDSSGSVSLGSRSSAPSCKSTPSMGCSEKSLRYQSMSPPSLSGSRPSISNCTGPIVPVERYPRATFSMPGVDR